MGAEAGEDGGVCMLWKWMFVCERTGAMGGVAGARKSRGRSPSTWYFVPLPPPHPADVLVRVCWAVGVEVEEEAVGGGDGGAGADGGVCCSGSVSASVAKRLLCSMALIRSL